MRAENGLNSEMTLHPVTDALYCETVNLMQEVGDSMNEVSVQPVTD